MISSLSAYIIVKNEARDLPGCLESLKGVADQVIVVDDNSSDNTVILAKEWGAKIYSRQLDGYGTQKQFALNQCTGEWVLSIDADERLTPDLSKEIKDIIGRAEGPDGYYVSRKMYFLGHRLRFGGVGKDWVLRFFKRAKGRYLPKEIHEQVTIDGSVARLKGSMDHFSYATLEEYLEKLPAYTKMAAEVRWKAGKRFSIFTHFRPVWELFNRVLVKGAWLDGQAGLIYAALSAHAAWLRGVKLWDFDQHAPK
jgi:glycosyltransferase involved in cell wall biosynthesis